MSDDLVKPDPEKKPKRPRDANQRAKMIVDMATGRNTEAEERKKKPRQKSTDPRKSD